MKASRVARILIAEDDPRIAAAVEKALQANGFATFVADNGAMAQSLSKTGEFDLLILDMGLPEQDGFHVLQELRWDGRTLPVLVLTGRSDRDVVACLDAGADDYMRKPFDVDELIARVQTRLRTPPGPRGPKVLTVGNLSLDLRLKQATLDEQTVELTTREFGVLLTLARHAGQILSRQQLLSEGWGDAFDPTSNVVDVCVNALRRKLGPNVVETVRGAGYRLPTR
jgi:DNA-binding response OmpR family regulator